MPTTTPVVSIILPTYNGSPFLRAALDSCLAQTLTDWELIVVDDGSTDATPEIIADYAARDARIRSVRNPVNRKLPGSLNVGFAQARGGYFTWTSDDNCYRPHALETMVGFLQERPAVDVVYTDFTLIDAAGGVVGRRTAAAIENIVVVNCVGGSFLYRRAVQEALGGYDEALFMLEDYDFWLRAAGRFRMEPLGQDLYLYRLHDRSLSAQNQEWIRRAHLTLVRSRLPHQRWLRRPQRAWAYFYLARSAKAGGDYRSALRDLWHGCRVSPVVALREVLRTLAGRLVPGRRPNLP